jgi:CheY-like chemotaxis protein
MTRLLVIDDNRTMRELLRAHLGVMGYSVTVSADATEAINALMNNTFDLIVCDIDMPYMNGLELLAAIKGDEKTRAIPVVMLTARIDDESFIEAIKLGAARYVAKPVRIEELDKEIKRALAADRAKKAGGTH